MAKYGLVGKNIDYSFSKQFFTEKFKEERRKDSYENFDLACIELLPEIINDLRGLKGLNVTIPYKETVIPLLDRVDEEAMKIGAVNTIKVLKNGKLSGYNTDHYGFAQALIPFLPIKDKTALILGTGGASKAIAYVLDTLNFSYQRVTRAPSKSLLTYQDLSEYVMKNHFLIINCTPLGTYPDITACPKIPYHFISKDHVLFDLIYNPPQTEFLKRGYAQGARISNGRVMLEQQALKALSIWRSKGV
ncbi:shikimate dehydrogenase family protein [Altibacter sp. HG106]|uniref:shikimate dehydrogenase family protein n=1 Tax=Altibacter sp. HG106 TaxID=3023937 RepID=UPI002350D9E3|nr:shikimate dehydrogenase [Altibacter sp. HG106]MDC7993945.1 shikimate dehydrogenase [Altibacter sp. HG106]